MLCFLFSLKFRRLIRFFLVISSKTFESIILQVRGLWPGVTITHYNHRTRQSFRPFYAIFTTCVCMIIDNISTKTADGQTRPGLAAPPPTQFYYYFNLSRSPMYMYRTLHTCAHIIMHARLTFKHFYGLIIIL